MIDNQLINGPYSTTRFQPPQGVAGSKGDKIDKNRSIGSMEKGQPLAVVGAPRDGAAKPSVPDPVLVLWGNGPTIAYGPVAPGEIEAVLRDTIRLQWLQWV